MQGLEALHRADAAHCRIHDLSPFIHRVASDSPAIQAGDLLHQASPRQHALTRFIAKASPKIAALGTGRRKAHA